MDFDEVCGLLDGIEAETDRARRRDEHTRLLAALGPGEDGRAEVLSRMAEDLMTDDRRDEARETYQAAVDDGGRTILDPRTGLLDIALADGDDARVDELLAQLMVRSRADELVVGDYEWIAESLEDSGRLRAALRWFTIPLRDIQPGDIDLMPVVCLDGRWRVRRALDLPVDAYDEAYEVLHSGPTGTA